MKWDYFRVLWSGRLSDAHAEIAEEVNDGMPVCTMAIVDRDGWIDDYDFVAQMFGGRMTRQAERAWVEYWNEVVGGLSPATCVSLVVYHH